VRDGVRVLLIVFNQVGRGTYWRAFHWGRILAQRGHDVTLMAMSARSRLRWQTGDAEGVHLIESPDLLPGSLRSGWDPWDTFARVRWLSKRTFEIVHAFESRPVVLLPALSAQRQGAKLIMDWCDWFGRGGSVEERPNPVVRAVLRPLETYFEDHFRTRADGTTVINTFLRERALKLGAPPQSVLLIRNGSDGSGLPLEPSAARRMHDLPLDAPLIGFVGGIYARDAELMAAALNQVRRVQPTARLLLVGYFNRGIERLLEDPSAVIRTGPVTSDQIYSYLAACDVCWLPLRDSGANRGRWPLKLNDYMRAGRPVIATDVGDLNEVVTRYALGVVTRDTADDFAAQTLELLNDADRRDTLGRAARRAAENEFSWNRLVDDLENFYQHVLDARPRGSDSR
jgi:glycosyltransferase involved in cell wall biosynthesis